MLTDFHIHSTFCDGKNTPEQTVLAALSRGFEAIGFSGHTHTPFDESWCMSLEGQKEYAKVVRQLKEKYRGVIEIYLGAEQDFYAPPCIFATDYKIGSVHFLKVQDRYLPVDESAQLLTAAAERFFGGDMLSLCECYFETVAQIKNVDIVGHFDLITKFSEKQPLFDENHPRYINAARKAIMSLCENGCRLFEVNTGAIARGLRTTPYPSARLLSIIRYYGGKAIITGDCHDCAKLGFGYDAARRTIETVGIETVEKPLRI